MNRFSGDCAAGRMHILCNRPDFLGTALHTHHGQKVLPIYCLAGWLGVRRNVFKRQLMVFSTTPPSHPTILEKWGYSFPADAINVYHGDNAFFHQISEIWYSSMSTGHFLRRIERVVILCGKLVRYPFCDTEQRTENVYRKAGWFSARQKPRLAVEKKNTKQIFFWIFDWHW